MSLPAPYYADEHARACECGCGAPVAAGRRFVTKHNLRTLVKSPAHLRAISDGAKRAWRTTRRRFPVGSKRRDPNGYVLVKTQIGEARWDKEHVLVVEAAIGRRLVVGECVHHINGIRDDNRLENLHLCANNSEHALIHGTAADLVFDLIRRGLVCFDRETKRYVMVEGPDAP